MASNLEDLSLELDGMDLEKARGLVESIFLEEMAFPGSPLNPGLIKLNLDHTDRVRANAAAIAAGEGLNVPLLELAAILHDVSKLDHRDTAAGGIDTWHHHHRGASLARKIILTSLPSAGPAAEDIVRMIECHSDIPFIRRYWAARYQAALPSPSTPEEFALRDADVIDMLWVAGMSKIVYFRQVPGSDFYNEDGGDIQKAIASARKSFHEASSCLSTPTSKKLANERIQEVDSFFARICDVRSLEEFIWNYDQFLKERQSQSAYKG